MVEELKCPECKAVSRMQVYPRPFSDMVDVRCQTCGAVILKGYTHYLYVPVDPERDREVAEMTGSGT